MTGHPLAAWLRRAVGVALIVGLLISAVAFYRVAPQLPRASPVAPTYQVRYFTSNCRAGQPEP